MKRISHEFACSIASAAPTSGPSWAVVVFGSAFSDAVVMAEIDANIVGTSFSHGYKFVRSADLGIAQGRRHSYSTIPHKSGSIKDQ
jgi:hypothetical protein